ncbi:MOSC beta barrel domain protein [Teladorsagia circumcincta]|uniref:MOSC beta barrel domain protein n=1 Tax=Teladorsagia circumcincta TaxID=45464 RepID=A0A2G9UN71_TELCI|nr:MOSC beta barrel domain protein [Teladorsagia circumcincta]
MISEDKKLLIGIVGASVLTYGVFSFYCHELGPVAGEHYDRRFIVVDGKSGRFYTARQKPVMVTIECKIQDGILTLTSKDGATAQVDLAEVSRKKIIKTATLHFNLRTDGLDCGDEAAEFFSKVIFEPDARLLMYVDGLFTERTCVTHPDWWNNNVPKRKDNCAYADLAPFMITTQASLDDLNTKLEHDVSSKNFRPVIVVDHCAAWDEDKWDDLQIGDTRLQCFRPCTRCVLTTVDPTTGIKDIDMQPLKELRQFRLAPDGPMREQFKDSPIFGVNVGVNKPGYIHVGQTVYARYKKSAF